MPTTPWPRLREALARLPKAGGQQRCIMCAEAVWSGAIDDIADYLLTAGETVLST
jgi:hypothetical protein